MMEQLLRLGHTLPSFSDITDATTAQILFTLDFIGAATPMSQLSARLGVTPGTLTKVAAGLVRMGYLIRKRSSEDDRVVNLSLADEGLQAIGQIRKCRQAFYADICDRLSASEANNGLIATASSTQPTETFCFSNPERSACPDALSCQDCETGEVALDGLPGSLEETSEEGWSASVDGNLTSTFLTIKKASCRTPDDVARAALFSRFGGRGVDSGRCLGCSWRRLKGRTADGGSQRCWRRSLRCFVCDKATSCGHRPVRLGRPESTEDQLLSAPVPCCPVSY